MLNRVRLVSILSIGEIASSRIFVSMVIFDRFLFPALRQWTWTFSTVYICNDVIRKDRITRLIRSRMRRLTPVLALHDLLDIDTYA